MKIVEQSWSWFREPNAKEMLRTVEEAGRTCYKSEDHITEDSAKDFVQKMISSGHHAMIEFAVPPPVKVITDRGVTHEIVRHRLFSYAQESTRYCNYSKDKFGNEITVILPVWFQEVDSVYRDSHGGGTSIRASFDHIREDNRVFGTTDREIQFSKWFVACELAAACYFGLLNTGQTPQEARAVLPNSLKTEINICGNVREWRHFFTLRCSNKAHPQMRELARDILKGFKEAIPVLFDDIDWR
jgi:thymidylate synthase (FAD)